MSRSAFLWEIYGQDFVTRQLVWSLDLSGKIMSTDQLPTETHSIWDELIDCVYLGRRDGEGRNFRLNDIQ